MPELIENQRNDRNSGGSKPILICHRCNRPGHIARNCNSRFPASRQRQSQSARNAEMNIDDSRSEADMIEEVAFLNFHSTMKMKPSWCLDSGCSSHMATNKNTPNDFSKVDRSLNLANNQPTIISGVGKARLNVDNGENGQSVRLENVYYVPDLRSNLMSVSKGPIRDTRCVFVKRRPLFEIKMIEY